MEADFNLVLAQSPGRGVIYHFLHIVGSVQDRGNLPYHFDSAIDQPHKFRFKSGNLLGTGLLLGKIYGQVERQNFYFFIEGVNFLFAVRDCPQSFPKVLCRFCFHLVEESRLVSRGNRDIRIISVVIEIGLYDARTFCLYAEGFSQEHLAARNIKQPQFTFNHTHSLVFVHY